MKGNGPGHMNKHPLTRLGVSLGVALTLQLGAAGAWLTAMAWPTTAHSAPKLAPGAEQPPAALYHNYCSVCHGDAGDGRSRAQGSFVPPPRNFTTSQALKELTRDRMFAAVKLGVPETAMAGWGSQLRDDQIYAVVDYVRDTFMPATFEGQHVSPGRALYARNCSVCHGDRGAGSLWAQSNLTPPPADFSSKRAKDTLSRERMIASVSVGRPGTAMAGFAQQLSAQEIAQTVDYIRTAFMRVNVDEAISGTYAHGRQTPADTAKTTPSSSSASPAAVTQGAGVAIALTQGSKAVTGAHGQGEDLAPAVKADMSLPMPMGLKGQAAKGKRFYEDNCAACHGLRGDAQGPRAYFIMPKPRNFMSPGSQALLNRPTLFAAISAGRRGTEMPAWDKVMDPQGIADVAEYVFEAFIQPQTPR